MLKKVWLLWRRIVIADPDQEVRVLNALGTHFYQVVPHEYKTYCAFASTIARDVLVALGFDAILLPCQLWCETPESNYVVGFTKTPGDTLRWYGHVVCQTKCLIIDTAVHNLKRDWGLDVPAVVVSGRFNSYQTQVISRVDLSSNMRLWWHPPPLGIDSTPPIEPQELVSKYVEMLIHRLR